MVYIILLYLLSNVDCGYSLCGGSNVYHDLCFDQKVREISEFSFEITILQILTSVYNASACLPFCEIIIISMKQKTVL